MFSPLSLPLNKPQTNRAARQIFEVGIYLRIFPETLHKAPLTENED